MKTICYYHSADLDGIGSAAIVKKVYPDAKLVGVDHDDDWNAADIVDSLCIIVDFSFPNMEELKQYPDTLCWIDHHKTAMEKNKKLWNSKDIDGIRSLKKSGCELTWEWFFPHEKIPRAIELIGDRDMWKFKYPETKDFTTYAHMKIKTPEDINWDWMLDASLEVGYLDGFFQNGKLLNEAQLDRVKKTFDQGWDGIIDGHKARFMNTNHDMSDVGSYASGEKGYPVAVTIGFNEDKIFVGLRSKTIDVSEIAKKRGGGGHKYAAGFTIEKKLLGDLKW